MIKKLSNRNSYFDGRSNNTKTYACMIYSILECNQKLAWKYLGSVFDLESPFLQCRFGSRAALNCNHQHTCLLMSKDKNWCTKQNQTAQHKFRDTFKSLHDFVFLMLLIRLNICHCILKCTQPLREFNLIFYTIICILFHHIKEVSRRVLR